MNLFDLPGPQFLGLYIALAIAVTYGLWWKRRQLELQATAVPRLDDPYQLAMLRKGPREVAGLAMLTLIDRKLIVLSGTDKLTRASGVTPAHAEHPIEKAALQILDSPESVGLVESGLKAHPVLESYRERLVRIGLLPGPEQNRHRLALWIAGFGLLLVVAAVKVAIGLSRSRPVAFLIGSCVFCAFVTLKACFPRLTAAGDEAVAHMEELFSSLKRRIGWRINRTQAS